MPCHAFKLFHLSSVRHSHFLQNVEQVFYNRVLNARWECNQYLQICYSPRLFQEFTRYGKIFQVIWTADRRDDRARFTVSVNVPWPSWNKMHKHCRWTRYRKCTEIKERKQSTYFLEKKVDTYLIEDIYISFLSIKLLRANKLIVTGHVNSIQISKHVVETE